MVVEGSFGPVGITGWRGAGACIKGGVPILALHGFTGSSLDFDPLFKSLALSADAWAIDLPGHGASYCGDRSVHYSLEACMDNFSTVLTHVGVQRFSLLGYSMGGRIALHYARRYPERVQQLILVSSSPGLGNSKARQERCKQDECLAKTILEEGMVAFIAKWQANPLIASQKNIPAHIRAAMLERRLRNRPIGLVHSLRGLGTGVLPSLWDSLAAIKTETQLVTGSNDKKFKQIAQRMLNDLPVARHVIIEGAGHAPHLEALPLFQHLVVI